MNNIINDTAASWRFLNYLKSPILNQDALFEPWPEVDAIVSNPPYQSKNKIQQEFGVDYINRLREKFPDIDGRSDYCVYWFRLAHNALKPDQRAGLIGTNTIRQNYSRESGLDKIIDSGGTIVEAVSSMIWPDEAAVDVSIVNWIKGKQKGKKRLYIQEGHDVDAGWRHADFDTIGPSLSFQLDVTKAKSLKANEKGGCYQGQTHGHKGFLVDAQHAKLDLLDHPNFNDVLFPFLIANELIGGKRSKPRRYVIDFHKLDLFEAQKYKSLFEIVEKRVLPDRKKAAGEEKARNKEALTINANARINNHHANFLNKWWVLSYPREEMIQHLEKLNRYIACGQVTKRPIFEFISNKVRPNAALVVFAHQDDYSFGILQSDIHWVWFINRCSTLTERFRYTSNTVFDSFPWPQAPNDQAIRDVAKASVELRNIRNELRKKHERSLRDIYRLLEKPGKNVLRDAHEVLDRAVQGAYGMAKDADPLQFLLDLNLRLYADEKKGVKIVGPGVPKKFGNVAAITTKDCIQP
jgi:hypothetical protein